MNILTRVISTVLEEKRRIVKVLRFGKGDVQTANEAAPYGVDGNPIKDMVAVFSDTSVKGDTVIVGYINKNQVAEPGELRMYSTDDNGAEKFYTWLKKDGTFEIGGDVDNMVRYSKLEQAFNQLRSDFNALVTAYNSHIHITTATIGTGPPGVIAPTATTGNPSTADILPAKINEIKTI